MAIYLDHAATTPLSPRVLEAMLPYLQGVYGNPSSIHSFGREARMAVDRARLQVARALNAEPGEILFTSGGTEADNLAVIGTALAAREQGKRHIITSTIEHHAVLDACKYLERIGFDVTWLPVDRTGRVNAEEVRRVLRRDTALISVMYGNNETGTLQPVEEIGSIARERGVLFHSDAVQAFGVEDLDVKQLPVDLLTVSAHKINGPKGVGALFVGRNVKLIPRAFGGSQERRRRPGTENVAGIVGFGVAAEMAAENRERHRREMENLRRRMVEGLEREGVEFVVNGHPEQRLPHILNVSFPGVDTETLLMNLDLEGIACASGSACTSGTLEVSHVLKAMSVGDERAHSAIRISFGTGNTEEEIGRAAQTIARVVRRLSDPAR
jgi:cysteine desulfurase